MSVWVWVVITVLIVANALYVAAEFAAVGVRQNRIRRMSDDGHRLARLLLPFLETPAGLDRYVAASQIGITLASLGLGAYAQATLGFTFAPAFERWLGLSSIVALSASAATVLVALTAAQLVLGELVPKALALQYPTATALVTVLPMRWSLAVFRPAIALLNGAAVVLLRAFGSSEQAHRHLHSPEEIDLLITESRDGGLLEPEERERLRRALHLSMRSARDLMVSRDRLTMVEVGASWEEALVTVAGTSFSRLPVYQAERSRIVGMLRVKDLVDRFAAEGPLPVGRLMRPIVTMPEHLSADRVLAELRERRAHSAIVVDANGAAVGLITVQDVLGELLNPRALPPNVAPVPDAARTEER